MSTIHTKISNKFTEMTNFTPNIINAHGLNDDFDASFATTIYGLIMILKKHMN